MEIDNAWPEINKREYLKDVLPLSTPLSVQITVSGMCNFKCVYCPHSSDDSGKHQNISIDNFNRFLEGARLFPRKIKTISFVGRGEPLINKNICEMMAKCHEIAKNVTLITNGSLLSPELIDKIIDSGVDTIRISLQGVNADDYYKICGYKIDFDSFLKNIEYLYKNKRGCKIVLKIPDIVIDTKEKEEICKKIFLDKCDHFTLQHIYPSPSPNTPLSDITSNLKTIYFDDVTDISVCPQPFYLLFIDADGNVFPCYYWYSPLCLGNLEHKNIYQMWNSEYLKQIRLAHLTNTTGKCKECFEYKYSISKEEYLDDIKTNLLEIYK
jgi:radical SAM protein with 4Fe4S-binding SPASM domain